MDFPHNEAGYDVTQNHSSTMIRLEEWLLQSYKPVLGYWIAKGESWASKSSNPRNRLYAQVILYNQELHDVWVAHLHATIFLYLKWYYIWLRVSSG